MAVCWWASRGDRFHHPVYTLTVCHYLTIFASEVVCEGAYYANWCVMDASVVVLYPTNSALRPSFFICKMWKSVGCSSSSRSSSLLSSITVCSLVLWSFTVFGFKRLSIGTFLLWGRFLLGRPICVHNNDFPVERGLCCVPLIPAGRIVWIPFYQSSPPQRYVGVNSFLPCPVAPPLAEFFLCFQLHQYCSVHLPNAPSS